MISIEWAREIDAYTTWLRSASRPATTIKLRRYQLHRMARELRTAPADVTRVTLQEWLAGPSWSPDTRRSFRSAARSFFGWRLAEAGAPTDPAAGLPIISATLGRPRPAAETVVKAAVATLDDRLELMARLGAYAGLRCCEICRVHTDDLVQDLLGWSLRVRGKGGRIREIPLDVTTAYLLRAKPAGWVFPGRIDGHLSASYVSKLLSRHMPEGVTAHMLRHRFASVSYARGGRDLLAVRELLGHASVATTQVYTAVPNGALREAVRAAAA